MPAKFTTSPADTSHRKTIDLRLIVFASLVLSLWLIYIDPIINRDAILYLRAAEAYLRDGLLASQQLYGRPSLSILIAEVHRFSGLSLSHAGLVLTSAFYALLCAGFVATIATLGGDRRVQTIAAIIILSHPIINDYRSSIMRDPAYWACMIMALRGLLLYAQQPRLGRQLSWYAWVIAATLFRFEGAFFALLAPLALLLPSSRNRWQDVIRLALPVFIVAAAGLALLLNHESSRGSGLSLFPAINSYVQQLLNLPSRFDKLASHTADTVLVFSAKEDANWAAVAALCGILLLNLCRAFTWPWLAVLIWGHMRQAWQRIQPSERGIINAHIIIGLLYLALFTLSKHFMLERYASIVSLFLLLYLAFMLSALWQYAAGRAGRIIALLLMIGMTGDVLHNGDYKKAFIEDATRWIRQQTPESATLMSNNMYIAYFSERPYDWSTYSAHDFRVQDMIDQPSLWQGHNFLAMRVTRRELALWQEFLQVYQLREAQVFEGDGRATIRIVKLPAYPAKN
ncbi:hypothetical protein H2508_12060 [Parahaliea sp. F7430]|uniref:Glycosyltransferase RgtA/B/C/D-like domain-containing protein n=1 Tax=Sediminihaliea albiluteola TaxID=2758564 RepID=A0A7W2TXP4_9GAMM|nr:hypothetical protein [Sediminihaliea albiluteola]MBA6413846.1 hypothetical protein [Sediminihaliea albiluteola]